MKHRGRVTVLAGALTVAALLCGCAENEAAQQADAGADLLPVTREDDFSEEEQQFIRDYNEILSTEEIPAKSDFAVSDPAVSDFAMISLPEEKYGTSVFAFLPLQSRALTREELIRLACAYESANPETILQDYCSYKEGSGSARAVSANRALTSRESFLLRVKLLSQYCLEGKRPAQALSQSSTEGEPLCFRTASSEKVWVYPRREMSEEQILQVIEEQYGDLPEETYLPGEGQSGVSDARSRAEELLADYVTDGEAEQIYLLYSSHADTGMTPPDRWTAYIHMKNGENDYLVRFLADTGSLTAWEKKPVGYFTEEGYRIAEENTVSEGSVTDEQLTQAAREYLETVSAKDDTIDSSWETAEFAVSGSAQGTATVLVNMGDETWNLFICTEDLSMEGVAVSSRE